MVHYKNYKMRNLSIVLAVLLAIPFTVLAQNQSECYNTVTFCPVGKRLGFTRNMQSFSGAFEQGDTSEVSIVVYKNMEYRISVCSPSHPELEGQFQFKIVEYVTKASWEEKPKYKEEVYYDEDGMEQTRKVQDGTIKKRVYKKEPIVRYDNSDDNMSQDFIFQSSQTRKLSIKVYVPDDGGGEMSAGLSGSNYACVGLLVEHQPGIITGFNR
tara:strand:+ start:389 stop:1024 length:636 start_codon:yes stop_codon:yes gene_type:complete